METSDLTHVSCLCQRIIISTKTYPVPFLNWRQQRIQDIFHGLLHVCKPKFMVGKPSFQFLQEPIVARTTHQLRLQHAICPPPESNALRRFNTISDRQNNIQIIILNLPCDGASPFILNCRKFCDSCHPLQFFFQRICYVFANRLDVATKQYRQLLPVQPYGLIRRQDLT